MPTTKRITAKDRTTKAYKQAKAETKKKFSPYPSRYANIWLSKRYRTLSKRSEDGKKRKKSMPKSSTRKTR